MEKEILDIIVKDADNVKAVFDISKNINEVKVQILKDKFVPLMEEIGKKHEVIFNISFDGCFRKSWEFTFKKHEWKIFKIHFQFEENNLRSLFYGFYFKDILPDDLNKYLLSLKEYDHDVNNHWPFWLYMEDYKDWDEIFFIELYSNFSVKKIIDVFENIIKEILLIVENKGVEL
jgi:hypothetical protein